jgi:hypothetical protein
VSGQGTGTAEHPGMTLRVYRISGATGEHTEVRPLTVVEPTGPEMTRDLPCTCPRCRPR